MLHGPASPKVCMLSFESTTALNVGYASMCLSVSPKCVVPSPSHLLRPAAAQAACVDDCCGTPRSAEDGFGRTFACWAASMRRMGTRSRCISIGPCSALPTSPCSSKR